ncbi:MAG: nucleotidyltransferase domain-containing protein [Syntrophaceae bacterium]
MLKFSQIPIEPEKYIPDLIEFCRKQDDIVALYLFGSRASGTHGPLSDIDIAVLLENGLGRDEYNTKELSYLGEANTLLHTDEISFVVLNKAPLTIQYGVIIDAKVLYSKDEEARLFFEETVIDKYMDFKPVLDDYDREFLRQIKEGTAFG